LISAEEGDGCLQGLSSLYEEDSQDFNPDRCGTPVAYNQSLYTGSSFSYTFNPLLQPRAARLGVVSGRVGKIDALVVCAVGMGGT
jgi:hypothetical protein